MAGTSVAGGFVFTGSGFDPGDAGNDPDVLDRPVGLSDELWKLVKLIADREAKGMHNAAFGHAVKLTNRLAELHSFAGGAYD